MSDETQEKPEEMASFFNARAAGYDEHMRTVAFTEWEFIQFYQTLTAPIEETAAAINVLDLGCGTGLELAALFQRAPNAHITGIDLSKKMLAQLRRRYPDHRDQLTLIPASYLTTPFGLRAYDAVISAMTIHHLLRDAKRALYEKIRRALKPGGIYVEGDSVTTPAMEQTFRAAYHEQMAAMPQAGEGHYHIDVPFSLDTQRALLLEAGFTQVDLIWQKDSTAVWNAAVYAAIA
jgi:tRNA (cmo5U34)-methyltransferase